MLVQALTYLVQLLYRSESERRRLASALELGRAQESAEAIANALAAREDWPTLMIEFRAVQPEAILVVVFDCGCPLDLRAFREAQDRGLGALLQAGTRLESLGPAQRSPAREAKIAEADRRISALRADLRRGYLSPCAFAPLIREAMADRFIAGSLHPELEPQVAELQSLLTGQLEYEASTCSGLFSPGSHLLGLKPTIALENFKATWRGGVVRREVAVPEPHTPTELDVAELVLWWWLGVLGQPGQVYQRVRASKSRKASARWTCADGSGVHLQAIAGCPLMSITRMLESCSPSIIGRIPGLDQGDVLDTFGDTQQDSIEDVVEEIRTAA